jgi:GAF domain-containing protein
MDAAVLVLMVLSIIAYLIAILIAVRVPVVRRIERRGPWLIVVLILGFLLLQRIFALAAVVEHLASGDKGVPVRDLLVEVTITLLPFFLLWGLLQVEDILTTRGLVTGEASQRAAQLELVNRISALVSSAASLDEILHILVNELAQALHTDLSVLMLIDESGEWAEVVAAHLPPDSTLTLGDRIHVSGNSVAQEVLQTRRGVIIHDAATDPQMTALREVMGLQGTQSLLVVPLFYRDRLIGTVGLGSMATPRVFTAQEAELVRTVANQAAVAIEQARLFAAEQERRRMAEALSQTATILTSTLDLNRVLELVLASLRRIIDYDSSAIFLRQGDQLLLTASQGFPEDAKVDGYSFDIDDSALEPMLTEEGRPMVKSDVLEEERFRRAEGTEYIRSWIGAPLWARGKLVGLLTVDHSQPGMYSHKDAEIVMNFANQAAIVIENARLFENQAALAEELEARNQELIQTQQKLIEAERLAVIGHVGLAMRHEINNPLTSVMGLVQWMLSEHVGLPAEVVQDLQTIERMAIRIRDIVNKLEEAKYRTITYMDSVTMLDLHTQEEDDDEAED